MNIKIKKISGRNIVLLVNVLTCVLMPTTLFAQDSNGAAKTPRLSFNGNAPNINLDWLLINKQQQVLSPDDYSDRRASELQFRLDLGLRQKFKDDAKLQADLKLKFERTRSSEDESEDPPLNYDVKNLYMQFGDQDVSQRVRVGRQSLSDDMSWYMDENLDGIRISRRIDAYKFDFSLTQNDFLNIDQFKQDDTTNNAYAGVTIDIGKKGFVLPYLLHRHDTDNLENKPATVTWAGVQAIGNAGAFEKLWLNSATRYGWQQRDTQTRALRGFALDAGASYVFEKKYEPTLTLGYAFGSGDTNADTAIDNGFRQSGLHSNESKFNGLQKFHYLGEVMDPELSNIEILTAAAGIKIKKRWSIDAIYHKYRQIELSDRLRGSDVNIDPSGVSRALGQELDLVVGYNATKRLDLNAVAGVFMPGEAFAEAESDQRLIRLEASYRFR